MAKRMSGEVQAAGDCYTEMLRPASARYALGKIEVLESRYFEKQTDPAIEREIAKEWIEDLAEYPEDLIHLACKNWRCSSQNYAPRSAGVLMESVKAEFVRRRCIVKNAENVLRLISE